MNIKRLVGVSLLLFYYCLLYTSLEHHIAEHRQEKEQKAVTEPLGGHPTGRGLAAGAFKVCPQLAEQLTPSAAVSYTHLVDEVPG